MKTKTIILVLIAFVGCLMLAQDAPRGFRNPADVVMMTTRSTVSDNTLTNGLIAYWGFESASPTTDTVGTNTLTMVGNVDCTSNGVIGTCSQYTNNQADYFKIASSQIQYIEMNYTNRMTCSLWMYLDAFSTTAGIVGVNLATGANNSWGLYSLNSSGPFISFVCSTNGSYQSNRLSLAVITNTWLHVAIVYETTNIVIYTNGVNAANKSMPADANIFNSSTLDFNIGCFGSTTLRTFDGLLDDTALFNRALTASEILRIYQAGTNGVGYPWTGY